MWLRSLKVLRKPALHPTKRSVIVTAAIIIGFIGIYSITHPRAAAMMFAPEAESGVSNGRATAVSGTGASGGLAVHFGGAASQATGGPPYYFGTLDTLESHAQQESNAGIKLAVVEICWADYEPTDGQFDAAYAAEFKQNVQTFLNAGMKVTLALGMHCHPNWLFNYPDSRFIDNNGNQSNAADLVFNQKLRDKAAQYFDRINSDIGLQNVWAIRLQAGDNAEMLYPDEGSKSSWWAYNKNAQNGPNMPASMPRNPLPGWKPGDRSVSTQQVGQWLDWYIQALDDSAAWQIKKFDSIGFKGNYLFETPGSGARDSQYQHDITSYLAGGDTEASVGAAWDKVYKFMPNKNKRLIVYPTGIADTSGANGDDSCLTGDRSVLVTDPATDNWSATRWVSRIADEYGLIKMGENPGYDAPPEYNGHYTDFSANGELAGAKNFLQTCHFAGMYWAHDEKIWDNTMPFSRYTGMISELNGGNNPLPPTPLP
jgi:hypothetical protein